jgi:plastocyanin
VPPRTAWRIACPFPMRMKVRVLANIILLSSLPGCSDRSEAAMRDSAVDSAIGTVALALGSKSGYKPASVAANGSIGGMISLQSVTADSVVAVTRDPRVCGDSASVTETRTSGTSLANVLVWVDDVASGKPLDATRRATVEIVECRFVPRLIAVNVGTTINFLSRDRVTHTSRFYRENVGTPVDVIYTVDEGQVVPSEKIASKPGIVEARHAQHPWTRGYIAVFDHPYYAITDERGQFTIDSLAPGTYTVKVWHEGMTAPSEQRVVVSAGGTGRLELALTLQ